ncbi:hypothetical protein [Lacticaseibacillus zhaodongensis]|uniref:hypothetical protein n=1 Tax=Lacticaseibacillus zhaodongensis TaxID=2668065 RepID=UPI0012D2AE05|nr:hypothetical protein [Lacticaseibacillus zhaodongensis]
MDKRSAEWMTQTFQQLICDRTAVQVRIDALKRTTKVPDSAKSKEFNEGYIAGRLSAWRTIEVELHYRFTDMNEAALIAGGKEHVKQLVGSSEQCCKADTRAIALMHLYLDLRSQGRYAEAQVISEKIAVQQDEVDLLAKENQQKMLALAKALENSRAGWPDGELLTAWAGEGQYDPLREFDEL